ncbi:MAG: GNAT family N-acetyltransferase, partial [Atopostipes suicloacalis]|nr:GNAT family N-acetyltransferase [Atopostipes suicloacalis]
PQIYPYVIEIFTAMEIPVLKEINSDLLKKILLEAMHQPRYRYGFENAWICEREGKIAGVFFSYPSEWERLIDGPLQAAMLNHGLPSHTIRQDNESLPGEWYLDTLVTDASFRRQGVGQEMLLAAHQIALTKGYSKISLNCEVNNLPAYQLYRKMGYLEKTKIILSNHPYYHMVKEI